MYINRIILRNVGNIESQDIVLRNDWTQEHLKSVLITGPNGSGKTTVLRLITLLLHRMAKINLGLPTVAYHPPYLGIDRVIRNGLIAIEICNLDNHTLWVVSSDNIELQDELRNLIKPDDVLLNIRGKPKPIPQLINDLEIQRKQLQAGATNVARLPNIIFLDAETRTFGEVGYNHFHGDNYTEPRFQWIVTYDKGDKNQLDLETMLRNMKLRDVDKFYAVIKEINQFFVGKRITDFDDNPKLLVELDNGKTHHIEALSSGERQCLLMMFMVSRWMEQGGIVLIDEPDLHLHVGLQRQFIHALEKLVTEDKQGQLIVTSHSPTLWEEYSQRQHIALGVKDRA